MNSKNSSQSDVAGMTALKLTMFTATRITTASHYATIDVAHAANAVKPGQEDCIPLNEITRARYRTKRAFSNQGNVTPTANWRIPFPTNDNMAPLRA